MSCFLHLQHKSLYTVGHNLHQNLIPVISAWMKNSNPPPPHTHTHTYTGLQMFRALDKLFSDLGIYSSKFCELGFLIFNWVKEKKLPL